MRSAAQLSFVAVLLAAALGVWWLVSREAAAAWTEPDAPAVDAGGRDGAPAPGPAAPVEGAVGEGAARSAAERVAVGESEPDAAPEPEEPFDPAAAKVDPWVLQVEVVDRDGAPVAGAEVTIWEARRAQRRFAREMGLRGNSYSGRHQEPAFERLTDSLGIARADIDLECFVVTAAKHAVGAAGERTVWHVDARSKPVRIVLERAITLRGVALRADGLPAVGAEVEARYSGMSGLARGRGQPVKLDPVLTDADGRFAFSPVGEGFGYALQARLGDERSFSESVWIRDEAPPVVVLSFPGAITLRGVVVDEAGEPVVGATVRSWREFKVDDPAQDPDADETARVATDAAGRFEIAVRKHTRYQVVASQDGYVTNEPVWLAPNSVRPHAEARLVLRRPSSITGRVVRGDGSPFGGVSVIARAEQGERHMYSSVPNRRDLYGRPESAKSDDDGRFELVVHPDTTWRLSAHWVPDNYRLSVAVAGIPPGATDVTIRVDDAALAGCVVRGVVSTEGGGEPAHYTIEIVNYEGGEPISSSRAKAELDGPAFTLAPLPLDVEIALRISPRDSDARHARNTGPLAPFVYGPFRTDRAELTIEAALQRWGELPVRVQNADGTPAVGVHVLGAATVSTGFYPSARPTDATGAILLERIVPGAIDLRVFAGSEKRFEERVPIEPGRNRERVVRLPVAGEGR